MRSLALTGNIRILSVALLPHDRPTPARVVAARRTLCREMRRPCGAVQRGGTHTTGACASRRPGSCQLAKGGRFPAARPPCGAPSQAARGPARAGWTRPGTPASRRSSRRPITTSRRSSTTCAKRSRPRARRPRQLEFVHFACTSEDINNLAYALMLREARERILLPAIAAVADHLAGLAARHAALRCFRARTARRPRRRRSARRWRISRRGCAVRPPVSGASRSSASSTARSATSTRTSPPIRSIDWRARVAPARRGTRPRAERAHDADRAARLDRGILRRARAREHDARGPLPRRLGLRFARLLRAEAAVAGRGRFLDDAAQGEPDRVRERRGQCGPCRMRCCGTSPRSCPCRAGSAT